MDRLHRLAAGKGDSDDGALALQFLKDGKEDDVQRADTWAVSERLEADTQEVETYSQW